MNLATENTNYFYRVNPNRLRLFRHWSAQGTGRFRDVTLWFRP
jgi:hypothetical protein